MCVRSNYVNCSRRNPKRSAQCVYHTGMSVYSAARAGISSVEKEGPIKNSSIIRWTFFQSLSTPSRREDIMDIDMVKGWETKEYYTANQLKKKCKKRDFQGIHDRFIRDVIEWMKIIETKNFVDDGMWLRMKITLTIWPHKNTSTIRANGDFIQISKVLILCHWGIDLISSKHRLPCNDCNKKQKKNRTCLLTLTSINNRRHAVHLLHGGIGKAHGGLFIIPKVKTEMHQVLSERGDLLLAVCGKILRHKTFMNSIYIVTDWSFTADGGLLEPTGSVNTTPQMTRFRDAKVCNNWLQVRIDDHRIHSGYKYKSELQNPEGKKSVLGITSAWWHRTTPMTTWPPRPWTPTTQRTWTLTRESAVLFVGQVRVVMIHIALRGSRLNCVAHVISSTHVMSVSPRPWSPFSSSSSSSHSSLISCTSSRTSSTSLKAVASLCTPPKRVLLHTLRDTQIRSMHEIGDMKRAQEFRVDEFSLQMLRKSHETVQELQESVRTCDWTGLSWAVDDGQIKTQSLSRLRSVAGARVQLNSEREHSGWRRTTGRLQNWMSNWIQRD